MVKSDIEELHGKVVVVFGGTYGIGQEICEICREYKTTLYVYSRSTGVDVSNSQSVRRVLSEIYEKEGRIDWIVNTAGILDKQPLANMSYEVVHRSIDINYLGNIIVAKESFLI